MFEKFKEEKKVKEHVNAQINKEIYAATDAKEMCKLMERKRTLGALRRHDIEARDVVKAVANIAIVAVLVGAEMSHILNQKGSRFVQPL